MENKFKRGMTVLNSTPVSRTVIFDKELKVTPVQPIRHAKQKTTTQHIITTPQLAVCVEIFDLDTDMPMTYQKLKTILQEVNLEEYKIAYKDVFDNRIVKRFFPKHYAIVRMSFINGMRHVKSDSASNHVYDILSKLNEVIVDYMFGFNIYDEVYDNVTPGYGWDGTFGKLDLVRANMVKQALLGNYEWEGITSEFIDTISLKLINSSFDNVKVKDREAERYEKGTKISLPFENDSIIHLVGQNKTFSRKYEKVDYHIDEWKGVAQFTLPDTEEFDTFFVIIENISQYVDHPKGVIIKRFEVKT